MMDFNEGSILQILLKENGDVAYKTKNEEKWSLDIITGVNNEKDVVLEAEKIVNNNAFFKEFMKRVIFSHFSSYSSPEDEGLHDAETLAYSKYVLGIEKLPVVSLSYKEVSPIDTCNFASEGLIDRKFVANVIYPNSRKEIIGGNEVKVELSEQKLSNIFSRAYNSMYGKNFNSSVEESIVCPIIVSGDGHLSVILIEATKQKDGTIKYKCESCDSSGYHFDKYFKDYHNMKSFYEGVDFQGGIGNCPLFALAAFKEFKNQEFKTLDEAHSKRNMIMLSVAGTVSEELDPYYGISVPGVMEVGQDFKSMNLERGFCLINYNKRKFVVNSNALGSYTEENILNDKEVTSYNWIAS